MRYYEHDLHVNFYYDDHDDDGPHLHDLGSDYALDGKTCLHLGHGVMSKRLVAHDGRIYAVHTH